MLTPDGIAAPLDIEGAADGAVVAAYVERCLVPALRPGQVVVLDNLSAHKGKRVRALVEVAGCRLLFLPAYSLYFTPIAQRRSLRAASAPSKPTPASTSSRAPAAVAVSDHPDPI